MNANEKRSPAPDRPPSAPSLFVVDDASFDDHAPRGYHPERPERLRAARRAVASLASRGVGALAPVAAREATDDELALVHEGDYLEELARLA
ncbi:MAG TPA: hypothetical protein VHB21_20605, partial [Minicystis sp.]|nr:hypothetical protein [Minicystis sp.]